MNEEDKRWSPEGSSADHIISKNEWIMLHLYILT